MSQGLQKLFDEGFVLAEGKASLIFVTYPSRLHYSSVHISQKDQKEMKLHKNLRH